MENAGMHNSVEIGDTLNFPVQNANGSVTYADLTVLGIIDYPATRVYYWAQGGYGIADRTTPARIVRRAQ